MSITLTTPITITIAGVTETDTIGALVSIYQDFQAMTQTAVYKIGTALTGSPLSLNQGPFALANNYILTVIFNINTGVWTYTYAGQSGGNTLAPGATLTGLQNQFIAARNQAEAFVSVTGGLMPGTQNNWAVLQNCRELSRAILAFFKCNFDTCSLGD